MLPTYLSRLGVLLWDKYDEGNDDDDDDDDDDGDDDNAQEQLLILMVCGLWCVIMQVWWQIY